MNSLHVRLSLHITSLSCPNTGSELDLYSLGGGLGGLALGEDMRRIQLQCHHYVPVLVSTLDQHLANNS